MNQNVKVGVRCRPLSAKELARECSCIVSMTDNTVKIQNEENHKEAKDYTFDHCYFVESTQQKVYEDLALPLLIQAIDGFNGTIFAYGQTGSGKSFTMMGNDSNKGIIPRLNDDLWKKTNEKVLDMVKGNAQDIAKGTTKFMITVRKTINYT